MRKIFPGVLFVVLIVVAVACDNANPSTNNSDSDAIQQAVTVALPQVILSGLYKVVNITIVNQTTDSATVNATVSISEVDGAHVVTYVMVMKKVGDKWTMDSVKLATPSQTETPQLTPAGINA